MYYIDSLPSSIEIGYTGEEKFRTIQIDMSAWMTLMPDGVPSIVHIRPGEEPDDAYIATTTFTDNILSWEITADDMGAVEGTGIMQVWLEKTQNTTLLKRGKSATVSTIIRNAINDAGDTEPPARTMLLNLEAEAETLEPGSSATAEWEHEGYYGDYTLKLGIPKGEKGDKGDKGDQGDPAPEELITPAVDAYLAENFSNPSNPPLDRSLASSSSAAPADMVGDLKSAIDNIGGIIDSYPTIVPYLVHTDGYINTDGTYTSLTGYDTYMIPIGTLDICHLSWSADFWGALSVGAVFTVKKSNAYERLVAYKTYGAFYSSGKEVIACGVAGVTELYINVQRGNETGINVAVNNPNYNIINDVEYVKNLNTNDFIRTQYVVSSSAFSYFNAPYGSYFIKMQTGDKIVINKTLTGVTGTGFYVASDGTATNVQSKEYIASNECIFCAYDNTSVSGSFTFIPANSIKLMCKDILDYDPNQLDMIVEAYTTIKPYLVKEDAYLGSDGSYVNAIGYDTYKIPLETLDVCRISWSETFYGELSSSDVFTTHNGNAFTRLIGHKAYGDFSLTTEAIVCAVGGIDAIYINVLRGKESAITIALNNPYISLCNDASIATELTQQSAIRSLYYISSSVFSYFSAPYGSYFVKMKAGDVIYINKSITGVDSTGRIIVADGTISATTATKYTASADCIFDIYDSTSATGSFTYVPKESMDSFELLADDVVKNEWQSNFDELNGVAFGTSLTYRSISSFGYLTKLSDLSGITFDNQGVGSATILGDGGSLDMLAKIKAYSSYAGKRVCILEGFVNDWYGQNTLGTYTDTAETSVCGCVRSALNFIMSQNANITVFLILDHYGRNNSGIDCSTTSKRNNLTQFEFYEEIAKVAESLGIPVIKEYAISQICENTPQYLADNIHLNALGAKQSAYAIWSQMKEYYPNQVN